MTPDTSSLPILIAPPLAVDASFDVDVALAYDIEWLDEPGTEASTPALSRN
ncbi:hypothetical protein [Phreatobacter sp. AB_2022a]|uniref:hypothetical protein n=1 Tax=Phreatobacter sp. AB_2022a TaxID=3003134 RepID=UPI000579B48F|nr:hypothetical protein [Phreatobacter sp. AB_2022a]MCZ0733746.1 hypothetical protein [Phreatobacter sp. AB_2022a]CEJ09990.1 hypothetical protein BN1110_00261 [bacterium YEK0313]